MPTRRAFTALVASGLTEAAFAQRAALPGVAPSADVAWLNGNEFPDGPPQASIEAMTRVLAESNRYHYQEFPPFYAALAAAEGLTADQILVGAGSSEVLHAAVEAFTSPTLPLITSLPTYEAPPELASAKGHALVTTPLNAAYGPDVHKMAAAAEKAGGGLIYLCHPNNPTSVLTTRTDMAWLVENLPPKTYLLVDEAYLHYGTSPDAVTALPCVRAGKNVIVSRTFSKIYGMAGLRAGFVAARPDLIQRMEPYRNNVISIVTLRPVLAALALGPDLIEERRARIDRTRAQLCAWLTERNIRFIPPQANFIVIETGQDARQMQVKMLAQCVAVGRPFPALEKMMRVTIGTDAEMLKFRSALVAVLNSGVRTPPSLEAGTPA